MQFVDFQERMRKAAEEDKKNKHVSVSGTSMEEALQKAAIELGTTVHKLEFEVVSPGSTGFGGFGKKNWVVTAYKKIETKVVEEETTGFEFDTNIGPKVVNGRALVRKDPEGIMLRVLPPENGGERVSEGEVLSLLEHKTQNDINTSMVSKIVKRADGVWVKVADFDHDPAHDPRVSLELVEMEMRALVTVTMPGVHGADINSQKIRSYLEMNNVVLGFLEDELMNFDDEPQYHTSICVAEGIRPQNGQDAKIVYTFETDNKIRIKAIEGGKVDFKELNNINNVVEGQMLARLMPPTRGEPGKTVTGKFLPAKDGKDAELIVGQNVKLSDDKKQAIAAVNGQVLISGGKLSVEPIFRVDGNVGIKTGNILFLGSVEVLGNVEDSFDIKAAGNIEIHGTVGKCNLDAEGDIIVHSGITGRGEAKITAGGNIWSKFIENANAEAGGIVVVNEGIINSNITCDHKIICRGKRAAVVGGKLVASEEIDAKTLGSIAGAETILEVGFDPKSKQKLDDNEHKLKALDKELSEIEKNVDTLDKLVKAKKELTPEKRSFFENLQSRQSQVMKEIKEIQTENEELHRYLEELKNNGRISASDKVYPGVRLSIKDAYLEVRNEFKRVTFVVEGGLVKVTRYEEADEDITIPASTNPKGKR